MSEKKFEPCTLGDATHVEMGGKMHELDVWESGGACKDYEEGHCVGIAVDNKDEILSIPISLFPILGIKTLKEKKQEPIEFIGYTKYYGQTAAHVIHVPVGTPLYATFRCVQILEEEK